MALTAPLMEGQAEKDIGPDVTDIDPEAGLRLSERKSQKAKVGGGPPPGYSKDGDPAHRQFFVPDLILVFPNPKHTTDKEEEAFKKKYLEKHQDRTHGHLFDTFVNQHEIYVNNKNTPGAQEPEQFDHDGLKSSSLKELRYHTIRMLFSFFRSFDGVETTYKDDEHKSQFVEHGACWCKLYRSIDDEEVFMAVKMNDHLSSVMADTSNLPVRLAQDENVFEKLGVKLPAEDRQKAAHVVYSIDTEYLFHKYNSPGAGGKKSPVLHGKRIGLLAEKVRTFFEVQTMIGMRVMNAFYPGSNNNNRAARSEDWCSIHPKVCLSLYQPIDSIKMYYGELIAFYFLFVENMLRAYVALLPFGIAHKCIETFAKEESTKAVATIIYVYCAQIWFLTFLRIWTRKEADMANQWGMDFYPPGARIGFGEIPNPYFTGSEKPSPLDNNIMIPQANKVKKLVGKIFANVVTIMYAVVLLMLIGSSYYLRDKYIPNEQAGSGGGGFYFFFSVTLLPLILTVQIKIFDALWDTLSHYINIWEQHESKYQFLQARSRKMMVMKVINSFAGFLYTGFVQPEVKQECFLSQAEITEGNPCSDLQSAAKDAMVTNLVTVFATYILFSFVEMLQPYLQLQATMKMQKKLVEDSIKAKEEGARQSSLNTVHTTVDHAYELSVIEADVKKAEYDDDTLIYDYLEILFPLAFVMFFSKYAPFAILVLALLTTMCKLRTSAWKMVWAIRRPFPERANGIGVWNETLHSIAYASIFFNILPFLVEMDMYFVYFPALKAYRERAGTLATKITVFCVMQNSFLFLKHIIDWLIPEHSGALKLAKEQQALQRARVQGATMVNFYVNIEVDGHLKDSDIDNCMHLDDTQEYFYVPDSDLKSTKAKKS